ncbi:10996_t:CDS:2 [Entrophospora sp. SA101]|nr:10996_t:CDS:2 [Entrophospora sp. SA101]
MRDPSRHSVKWSWNIFRIFECLSDLPVINMMERSVGKDAGVAEVALDILDHVPKNCALFVTSQPILVSEYVGFMMKFTSMSGMKDNEKI